MNRRSFIVKLSNEYISQRLSLAAFTEAMTQGALFVKEENLAKFWDALYKQFEADNYQTTGEGVYNVAAKFH